MWHVGIEEVKYEFYITSLQNLISFNKVALVESYTLVVLHE